MSLKKYEKVYLENKEKIREWEKTLAADEERVKTLNEKKKTLMKEKEKITEKIETQQIIIDALAGKIKSVEDKVEDNLTKSDYAPEDVKKESDQISLKDVIFVMHGSGRSGRVYNATLKKMGKFYYVMEGSLISSVVTKTKNSTAPKLRNTHKAMITKGYKVKAPIPFPSPSVAASFVIGYTTRGDDLWVDPSSGLTIKEFENNIKGGKQSGIN